MRIIVHILDSVFLTIEHLMSTSQPSSLSSHVSEPDNTLVPQLYVFSRDAIREVDRIAVEEYAIPGIVLMENACRALFDEAIHLLESLSQHSNSATVFILCGKGNNGGDGLAVARHLSNFGIAVHIVLLYDPESVWETLSTECQTHLEICKHMTIPVTILNTDDTAQSLDQIASENPPDLIIDGLFGTGLTRPPRQPYSDTICWMNHQDAPILAIDVPSGLDCDTGESLGEHTVCAAATITFVGLKMGFLEIDAHQYLGNIVIGDIGVPRELIDRLGTAVPAEMSE